MEGIIIKGIGAYTPSKIVTNDDLSKIVETSDEWIRSRTGIKERRISQGEDTSYMGIKASEKAIELLEKALDTNDSLLTTVSKDSAEKVLYELTPNI